MKHWLLLWRNCLVLSSDPFCIRNLVFTGKKKRKRVEPEELCKHYSPSNHSERQLWDPLVFLLPRKRDSCPRGTGWKEGRWYTDEEKSFRDLVQPINTFTNAHYSVPLYPLCSSGHQAGDSENSLLPTAAHTAPKHLSLLGWRLSASLMYVLFL